MYFFTDDDTGAAFIYNLNANLQYWTLTARLAPIKAIDGNNTYFGNGVWIYQKYAVVGAPGGILIFYYYFCVIIKK